MAPTLAPPVPFFFTSARQLLRLAEERNCSFSELARANERVFRTDEQIHDGLRQIWTTMKECVARGLPLRGSAPGRTTCGASRS